MPPPAPRPPRRWRRILARVVELGTVLVAAGALALWCSVPNTAPLATENPTSTAFIDLRRAQARDAGKAFDLHWEWRPIGKISRYLRAAVIYAEDYRFYQHDGVDWDAIEKAVDANLDRGSLAIGGSTITQQVAKNLYLSPSRSFIRKLREMLIAFSLEDHLTKTRILELYLNIAEWGDGVFGAEAAARKWFGHSAQSLSPAEAVRLAIALPNPFERAPNVRSPMLTKKAVRLIRLLRVQGLVDESQERAALDAVGAKNLAVMPRENPTGKLPVDPEPADPDPAVPAAAPASGAAPAPASESVPAPASGSAPAPASGSAPAPASGSAPASDSSPAPASGAMTASGSAPVLAANR